MSAFTDFRDSLENPLGIGPDSTGDDIANTVASVARPVGSVLAGAIGGGSQPPAPPPTAPLIQKVQAAVGANSKTLLYVAVGIAAVIFIVPMLKRRG